MTSSESPKKLHALVFGASGLAGWGVVNQLLSKYPVEGTFSKVTALVNRPLNLADSYWPSISLSPELNFISGVNLTEGTIEEFTHVLKGKVGDVADVTHVYFFAYKQEFDPDLEVKINRGMLERVIGALNVLSPNLKFVVFPGGAKAYGIQIPGGAFKAPFKEDMGPLPEPWNSQLCYRALRELLTEASKGHNWTWCEVCPDAIVGFAPNGSTFSLAAHWANYLSTYALVEGKGAEVPFPGSEKAYVSLFNDASSEIIAKFAIYASLHPSKCGGGKIFNIADQANPSSMKEHWPAICKYFGLQGVSPTAKKGILLPGEYVQKNKNVLNAKTGKKSVVFRGDFLDSYGLYLDFDRHFCLDRARSMGFTEEVDPCQSWYKAFDKFRRAGMMPE